MGRPRLTRKELARSLSPPRYETIPVPRQHVLSRPQNIRPLILFAHSGAYTQLPNLPRLPGQVGFAGDPLPKTRRASRPQTPHEGLGVETPNDNYLLHPPLPLETTQSKNTDKRVRQWKRWQDTILPSLIQPYLQLLAASESLSVIPSISFPRCILQSISFHSCQCLPPVAEQLIAQGLFPCAPLVPSLVVDMRLLDLASRLFLHMPPNNTAWCKTLEEFLSSLGFRLRGEDNLRRRFENALRWYTMLKHLTSHHVSLQLESIRSHLRLDVLPTNNILPSSTPFIVTVPSSSNSTQTSLTSLTVEGLVEATPHRVASQIRDSSSTTSRVITHTSHKGAAFSDPISKLPINRTTINSHQRQGPPSGVHSRHTIQTQETESSAPRGRTPIHNHLTMSQATPTSQSSNVPQPQLSDRSVQTPPTVPSADNSRKRPRSASQSSTNIKDNPAPLPFPTPENRTRPSEYLRKRCPLCFGGEFPSSVAVKPDAIVCLDACFTQKRNKGSRDPERVHPETSFIPEPDLQRMQSFVESTQTPKETVPKGKRQRDAVAVDEPEDIFEGDLAVPVSVLDGCESSFTAADERCEKASTKFFDDTALMAMLCRHDRVLWIANMRSAGEKQHYALVLLETLFQHLPLAFVIGILYDIGCQLHCSCLVYHPRKCVGFGLSDGEGCERFWHSISKLIPVLRVSGYHQRLYVLDAQVQHLDHTSLKRLGHWLLRRIQHCQRKRLEAEKGLAECGQPETLLRAQWKAQVHAQTRPLPRRSKNQGKNAVEEVIRLRKAYDIQKKRTYEIEQQLSRQDADGYIHALAAVDIQDARKALKHIEGQLRTKEHLLGVNQKAQLSQLINDPYISFRMNALALKTQLRDRLRARKFELNPIERMGRKFTHNTQKLHTHTDGSVRRRDPTIQQIARAYNKLCDEMNKLAQQKKALVGSICPVKVPLDRLFSLDVDDSIWQDIGLNDETPSPTGDQTAKSPSPLPPLWLSNEKVRDGIKAMLERDRCIEEEMRLVHERRAMQVWFHEEWTVVNDAALCYELEQRKKELCLLQVLWSDKVSNLPSGSTTLPAWGLTESECVEARKNYFIPSIHAQPEGSDSGSDGDDEEYNSDHEAYSADEDGEELDVYSELFM
ncbi:hypothetical protein BDN72DRAFT_934724 [Pluteus cervinus]|uniref:Uncharacterized protein n=1 Tax=Pluteus cervinus TaxID=181527 RepID=A0ACD3A701_9AGAR|nr:hypothetical protein BDN72DRAFT_934724 [Pluteus cervinus]